VTTIIAGTNLTCAGVQDTLANNPLACGTVGTDATYVKKYGFASATSYLDNGANDTYMDINLYQTIVAGAGGATFDFENSASAVDDLTLSATSSNAGVLIAWAYTDAGADAVCSAAGPEAAADTADSVVGVAPRGDNGAEYRLCLYGASASTAATSTIVVKADGVTAVTITVTAVGPVASVTLSAVDGAAYIAEENLNVAKFWSIVAKDSAGTIINGYRGGTVFARSVSVTDLDFAGYALNPKNQNSNAALTGSVIDPLEDGTDAQGSSGNAGLQRFDLNDGVCQEDTAAGTGGGLIGDGDAGKSYDIKVYYDTTVDVISNAVTITCTGQFDGATVSKVEALDNDWAPVSGGDLEYQDAYLDNSIYVVMSLKDAAGRPLGAGITVTRADVHTDQSVVAALNWDAATNDDLLTDGNGQIVLGDVSPDVAMAKKYEYKFKTITNAGAYSEGDDDLPTYKWFSLFYNAADSSAAPIVPTVKRNALKRKATITVNCGAADSNEVVPFDVELANGDLVVYDRKANIDGVVKLVLNKRNTTVRVVAACTDGDSEVATVRFR